MLLFKKTVSAGKNTEKSYSISLKSELNFGLSHYKQRLALNFKLKSFKPLTI